MAITITIDGTVTLDESSGLQNSGSATSTEDNNDSDLALALPSSLSTRLFTDLALSNSFATANGIAKSSSTYISLSGTGNIVSLGFTGPGGAALPVYGGADPGAACNLLALDGGAITLFADPVLGNRLVYGVDTEGDIVFALFMEPNGTLTSAAVYMVQFEAIDNPIDTNHDDPLALTGLSVSAGVSTEFNFNALPSGQNLFGTVGDTSTGLIVIGAAPVVNPDGTFTNASDTINTSQGGGPTTIGVDNQMFDPGDGAFFTFVKNPVPNYLAGAPGGLDQNEADDADNMQYTGGTIESDGGFVKISQIQGNSLASLTIAAYNIDGAPQGQALLGELGDADDLVILTRIKVYNAAGTLIEDTGDPAFNSPSVEVSFNGGIASVSGLGSGYKVEFLTGNSSIKFDQVLITGTAGKFDIGGFGVNEATSATQPLTGVRFEDDGPDVVLTLDGDALLTVDDSDFATNDSITFAALFETNSANFGTDGQGTDGSVYKLLLGDPNSGLFDTLTGQQVILGVNVTGTVITGTVNAGATPVFTITLDPVAGTVTLDQLRAMVHDDDEDDDEATSPLTLATGTVSIQRTIKDGDDDTDSASVDISEIFEFRDDGPSLPPATQSELDLITDDTDLTPDTATLSTDSLFPGTPDYGNDGPHEDNPIIYELRLAGPDPDPDSGLVDTATGKAILLKKVGAEIIGYVDASGDGTLQAGETTVAIKYSLTGVDEDTTTVTFTQYRAVVHGNVNDHNESATPETITGGLVFIDQTAIDGDDDVSGVVSFDLGAVTQLLDDGPSIGGTDGEIADGLVDFAAGATVTNDLEGVVGKDPNASPYKITSYTPTLTVNGVELRGVLSLNDTKVTYWADTGDNGTFGDAGDTAYYELLLGDQGGSGDYTFNVLVNPPQSFTPFDFSDLPSGQNLFGAIAADKSNLDGMALFVISKNADINNPGDGQMTNVSGTVNTSKGGGPVTIGDSNQMYDPGEGAYFVYLSNPDDDMVAGVPGGLTQNTADDADTIGFADTQGTKTASVEIVQTQGNALATMNIKCFDIDMSFYGAGGVNTSAEARSFAEDPEEADDPVNVTAVRVYNAAGDLIEHWEDGDLDGDYDLLVNSAAVDVQFLSAGVTDVYYARVSGVGQGYTIEFDTETDHDMTLVEGVAGKYDIGGFNIFQGNDTPDQKLDFTAKVTDGDGDTDTASWSIGIDGTGAFDDNSVSGVII